MSEHTADRLSVFDVEGTLLRRLGGPGRDPGMLRAPTGVRIVLGGRLFAVAEAGNNRLSVFHSSGAFERVVGQELLASRMSLHGLCDAEEVPTAGVWLLVFAHSNLLVQMSRAGDALLANVGDAGMFAGPTAISYAPGHGIYVVDTCGRQYKTMVRRVASGAVRIAGGRQAHAPRTQRSWPCLEALPHVGLLLPSPSMCKTPQRDVCVYIVAARGPRIAGNDRWTYSVGAQPNPRCASPLPAHYF